MKKLAILSLVAALAISACAPVRQGQGVEAAPAEPTIFVIRHLHKAAGDDPPLSARGAEAAERLADMLEDRGITALFATPTRRAMDTAAPLSRRIGVPIAPYDPRDPQALAARARAAGGSVLIVGHSNTVPDLVARVGGPAPAPLGEEDYGTVFAVSPDGRVETFTID